MTEVRKIWQNPVPIHEKTLNKLRVEGEVLQLNTEHLQKMTTNIVLNGERLTAYCPKLRSKARFYAVSDLIQYSAETIVIRQEKEMKACRSERKLPICR